MTDTDKLIGGWWGALVFGGQNRALAIKVTRAGDRLEGAWRMSPARNFAPIEVRETEAGVTFSSPQLVFTHRGPIAEKLTGAVSSSANTSDMSDLSFWLS